MPKPMAICIEDLDAPTPQAQYVRCVAMPGRGPGLRLDHAGAVIWRREEKVACELWVSADDRLILYRPESAPSVTVSRAGRSLDAPFAKPVVLVDQDEIRIGGRHLRVHIHGMASAVAAPAPFTPPRSRSSLQKGLAAAAVIGTVAMVGSCKLIDVRLTPPAPAEPTIDVRDTPPVPERPTETATIDVRDQPPEVALEVPENAMVVNAVQGVWQVAQAYEVEGETLWLKGILSIGGDVYSFVPEQEAPGPSIAGALDFLWASPTGIVTRRIDVYPQSDIRDAAEGTVLGTFTFEGSLTTFEIRMGEGGTLRLVDPSGGNELWSASRELLW